MTTPTPSRRRVVIFSTTTQGIRLRRRVDVFFRRRRTLLQEKDLSATRHDMQSAVHQFLRWQPNIWGLGPKLSP